MNRNLKGKSYNEVMNEWAAQKNFLKRAAGKLTPGSGLSGGPRIRSWIWRIVMLLTVVCGFYVVILRFHVKGGEFNSQLAAETKKFLGAESVSFGSTRWDMNGDLRMASMLITGKPQNIFSSIKAENLSTVIRIPGVFRSAWDLDRLVATSCEFKLRPGTVTKRASVASRPELLTAGFGVSPDFSKLTINGYDCGALSLAWGSAPSTGGEITSTRESPAKTSVTKNDGGWNMTVTGGHFRQCWLGDLRITKAEMQIGADRADISRGDFTVPGGGLGTLTGGFTLGEQPEVDAIVKLENIPLHQFTSEYFAAFVKATGNGTVKISGSTNRTNGLLLDASLKIQSGKLLGIPVLRALELATNETGISAPEITGGDAHITSQGTQDAGGIVIEADSIKVDCGTRLKLSISVRHERKQVLAKDLDAAKLALENKTPENSIAVSTTGVFRIGLPPATAAKLKPAIRQQFITREEEGMHWMDIPFSLDTPGEFTKDAAEKITALHFTQG